MIARVLRAWRFWMLATPGWCRVICYLSVWAVALDIMLPSGLQGAGIGPWTYFMLTLVMAFGWVWSAGCVIRRMYGKGD